MTKCTTKAEDVFHQMIGEDQCSFCGGWVYLGHTTVGGLSFCSFACYDLHYGVQNQANMRRLRRNNKRLQDEANDLVRQKAITRSKLKAVVDYWARVNGHVPNCHCDEREGADPRCDPPVVKRGQR